MVTAGSRVRRTGTVVAAEYGFVSRGGACHWQRYRGREPGAPSASRLPRYTAERWPLAPPSRTMMYPSQREPWWARTHVEITSRRRRRSHSRSSSCAHTRRYAFRRCHWCRFRFVFNNYLPSQTITIRSPCPVFSVGKTGYGFDRVFGRLIAQQSQCEGHDAPAAVRRRHRVLLNPSSPQRPCSCDLHHLFPPGICVMTAVHKSPPTDWAAGWRLNSSSTAAVTPRLRRTQSTSHWRRAWTSSINSAERYTI